MSSLLTGVLTRSWLPFLCLMLGIQTLGDALTTAAVEIDLVALTEEKMTDTTFVLAGENPKEMLLKARYLLGSRQTQANLTAITWAHAVNSQQELDVALSSAIQMIEADIVLGQLNGTGPALPVMAHPPANSSDISLEAFLRQITAHNAHNEIDSKGVKLDFKTIEVFEGSLDILTQLLPTMTYPVWLNADIVSGPVNQTDSVPVDPDRFLAGCSRFERAVLSIGWTTRWGPNYTEGAYTPQEIDNMVQAIKTNNVAEMKHPITFPVRAGIAANSQDQLHELLRAVNDTNESSLTIWSSQNDNVDIAKLRQLIFSFGFDRVYLDVPEEVSSQLDLGRGEDNSATLSSMVSFGVVSVCLLVASFLLQRSKM